MRFGRGVSGMLGRRVKARTFGPAKGGGRGCVIFVMF